MANEFLSLIKHLPKDISVVDAGCGGLSGENTTIFLLEHFGPYNIKGICKPSQELTAFKEKHPYLWIAERLFLPERESAADLLVHDLNIEADIELWENLHKYTKFDRILTYVMCTDDYGGVEDQIREHWAKVYGGECPNEDVIQSNIGRFAPDWEIEGMKREERRIDIIWVLLKRRG